MEQGSKQTPYQLVFSQAGNKEFFVLPSHSYEKRLACSKVKKKKENRIFLFIFTKEIKRKKRFDSLNRFWCQ